MMAGNVVGSCGGVYTVGTRCNHKGSAP